MTANLLYALGTLSAWIGVALLLASAFSKGSRGMLAGVGGLLMLIAVATPAFRNGVGVPLVWFAMPFAAWGAITCGIAALACLAKLLMEGNTRRLTQVVVLAAAAIVFVFLYRLDPENQIGILRGRIALGAMGLLAVVAFAVAAVAAMVALGRRGKPLATHAALLAGCVVFGLPFAWLLITSFKEDRDMASPNGIVWVPKVQRTVPYLDPEQPLLEGSYQGNWVQATLVGRTSEGGYVVEVQRPSSLRGVSFEGPASVFKVVPRDAPVVAGKGFTGFVAREMDDGRRLVRFMTPTTLKGQERTFLPSELEPVRDVGLRTQNYTEALEAMPPETNRGLVYLKNTLILAVLCVVGTLLSSSLVAYGFARLRFPGRDLLFKALLATMMLPGAVTLMPRFLLFRSFHWIDTLYPLWVPAFFASAFNVFLLRQFFAQVPAELEDAGKIDGAGVLRSFWSVMLPQIKPALAVVAIWTFMGAWNDFMGPLLYVNTPENMPLSYALQLFQSERGGEPGLMLAFATLTILPVLALFFFAQRYFVEGVTLSGLGGR
ncbi:carbohydrate ABC transporter permease [bacterium]|nr:MAG: carbohydrate ABC transporter permease [bacterium]